VTQILGENRNTLLKRLINGTYPEPKTRLRNGHRRFTADEVLLLAEIKEKLKIGLR